VIVPAGRPPGGAARARRAALLLGLAPLPLATQPVSAATTFEVNSTADPGDGTCNAAECTLREAIAAANADADLDTITFRIPGNEVQTISPRSELPTTSEPVVIDGYTQPGARENRVVKGTKAKLRVELDGSLAGGADGLVVAGGDTTIRGLVINDFAGIGILLENTAGNTNNVVEGNFIGTNAAGTDNKGNGPGLAIRAQSTGSQIGGGRSPAARNLISGNESSAVSINSNDNEVAGNLIGTDRTGRSDLGNDGAGVVFSGGSDNLVAGNVIAFNFDGVAVNDSTGNRILGNSIFDNRILGIDLDGNNDVTPNDPNDPDTGDNNLQNFPVVTSATKTTIAGTLDSLANTTFRLELFANPAADGAEGKTLLGQFDVTTNGNGDAAFLFRPDKRVRPGQAITATATNLATGDTSEFSEPELVQRAQ